jgi:cob(I)alamin adenosyltransferase
MSHVIYTRTGDQGDTSLACGRRLPKDDLRIESYGTIDELSSILGVVAALFHKLGKKDKQRWAAQIAHIEWIQDKLFTLSGMIATANLPQGNMPELLTEDVAYLERHIDEMEQELPELRNFILPGGSELVSFIHLARTICRRAERACTTLNRESSLHPVILPFLNRLSDELFVLARWVCYQRGEEEKIWLGRKHPENKTTRIKKAREDMLGKLLHKEDGLQLNMFETPE